MSQSSPSADGPTSREEFNDRLGGLIRTSYENGVDVEGGWAFREDDDGPDWGVEIYEVMRRSSRSDDG